MGFLHKLWDETVAGPAPESGLGRLRKYNSFSAVRSPDHHHHHVDDHHHHAISVSRSITILRPKNLSVEPVSGSGSGSGSISGPSSPALSSGPPSPFSPGTPSEEEGVKKGFTRRKKTLDAMEHAEPSNPTVYDWIMISSLDR